MRTSIAPRPWSALLDTAMCWAAFDHEHGEHPRPRLFGHIGDEPFAVIDLRPFPPGGAREPIVEAMAGLLASGCDRVAAALPGRAWSLDDPVVPVCEEGDLRQQVLTVAACRRGGSSRHWLVPFECTPDRLVWGDARAVSEPVGWIHESIAIGVEAGLDASIEDAADQLARCSSLGHQVMLAPSGAAPAAAYPPSSSSPGVP